MASTNEYWVGEVIGEGSFGTVIVHGRHKTTKLDVAIKCMSKQLIVKQQKQNPYIGMAIMQEQKILKRFKDCKHIINLYASFHDRECVYLITECCTGGTLQDIINNNKSHFTSTNDNSNNNKNTTSKNRQQQHDIIASYYGIQLLEAISYIHKHNIIHCDIKPENCLLTQDGVLKLADFGCSVDLNVKHIEYQPRGTTSYSAPEVIHGKPIIDYGADIWSFGCVLIALLVGKSPFQRETDSLTIQSIQEYNEDYNNNNNNNNNNENDNYLDQFFRKNNIVIANKDNPNSSNDNTNDYIDKNWKDLCIKLLHPNCTERLGAKDRFHNNSSINDTTAESTNRSAETMYPSIYFIDVWKHSSSDHDKKQSLIPKYSPKWWKNVDETKFKDGKDGWSVFLV